MFGANNHKHMKKLYWSLLACLLTGTAFGQEMAKGTVFIDANANGRLDKKEAGLAGVSVSNGKEVVQTDKNGNIRFRLKTTTSSSSSNLLGMPYLLVPI